MISQSEREVLRSIFKQHDSNHEYHEVEYLKSELISQKPAAPEDDEINMTNDKIIADLVFRIGNMV